MANRLSRASFIAGSSAVFLPRLAVAASPIRSKRILILGGTFFLGPNLVTAALGRGHIVTLFNRGITNPQLFPELEKLRGNRYPELGRGLAALGGQRQWDAVIDTCAPLPRVLNSSIEALRGRVGQYIFISTIAVYADFARTNILETDPLNYANWKAGSGDVTDQNYPGRKAWMERTLQESGFAEFLIVRPTVITGPRDNDDSPRYWPTRVARGGEVLAPGDGLDPLQFIDARDLSEWIVRSIDDRTTGVYNVVGPRSPLTFERYLSTLKEVINPNAQLTWVSADFLRANNVFIKQMPFFNDRHREYRGWQSVSNRRALAAGLTFRPLREVAAYELARQRANFPPDYDFGSTRGLNAAREAALLAQWHTTSH